MNVTYKLKQSRKANTELRTEVKKLRLKVRMLEDKLSRWGRPTNQERRNRRSSAVQPALLEPETNGQTTRVREILELVAKVNDYSLEGLLSAARDNRRCVARWTAMLLIQEFMGLIEEDIAMHFDGMNRGSVNYGVRQLQNRISVEPKLSEQVEGVRKILKTWHWNGH